MLLWRSIFQVNINAWGQDMSSNKLPIDIDAELRELGVLSDDLGEDLTLDTRAKLYSKKEREADRYAMPVLDENGEPNF